MKKLAKIVGLTLAVATMGSTFGFVGCAKEAKLVFEKIEGKEEYAVVDIQTPYGYESPQEVKIPSEYKGLPVTKVILSSSDYINKAYLPSSVTHTEGLDWDSISTLEELHIESLESYLNITYSNLITSTFNITSWDLYVEDTLVKEIDFDGLNYQKTYVSGLAGCRSLEKVDLAETRITFLGDFMYCTSLKEISSIPSTVTKIGEFTNCTSLQEFKIPYSVTEDNVAGNAFSGCTGLKKILYPAGRTYQAITNLAKTNTGLVLVEY